MCCGITEWTVLWIRAGSCPRRLSKAAKILTAGRVVRVTQLYRGFSTFTAWTLSPFPGLDFVLHCHQHHTSTAPPTHTPHHIWDRCHHQPPHNMACTLDSVRFFSLSLIGCSDVDVIAIHLQETLEIFNSFPVNDFNIPVK